MKTPKTFPIPINDTIIVPTNRDWDLSRVRNELGRISHGLVVIIQGYTTCMLWTSI
jgi:hypothetical protein